MPHRVFLLILGWRVFACAGQSAAVLKGEGRKVVLDVVARDKHGRIARDLRAEELRITDDSAEVKPPSFRLVAGAEAAQRAQQAPQPRLFPLLFEQFGPEGRASPRKPR